MSMSVCNPELTKERYPNNVFFRDRILRNAADEARPRQPIPVGYLSSLSFTKASRGLEVRTSQFISCVFTSYLYCWQFWNGSDKYLSFFHWRGNAELELTGQEVDSNALNPGSPVPSWRDSWPLEPKCTRLPSCIRLVRLQIQIHPGC